MADGPAAGARSLTRAPILAPILFCALALAAGLVLIATQHLRAEGPVIDRVQITATIGAGRERPKARIQFRLRESEPRGSVLVERPNGERVKTLASGVRLDDYRILGFRWDGTTDAGEPAPAGEYRVEVQLPDRDREVLLPDSITVER